MMRLLRFGSILAVSSAVVISVPGGTKNSASFTAKSANAETYVVFTRADFFPKGHKILKVGDSVTAVDGIYVMGTDGEMPHNSLRRATIFHGREQIRLDVTGCFDPWSNAPPIVRCERIGSLVRVYALFSDGAGAYAVAWQVRNGISFREIFSNDQEVMASIEHR